MTGKAPESVREPQRVTAPRLGRLPRRNEGGGTPRDLDGQLRLVGLPAPVLEYPFAKPERAYRADLAWPNLRLLVEVDGAVHRIKERFSADLLRDQVIFFMGWRKLRVSPMQVRNGEALRLVERALEMR